MSHQRYRKDRQEKRWVRYVMAILKRIIASALVRGMLCVSQKIRTIALLVQSVDRSTQPTRTTAAEYAANRVIDSPARRYFEFRPSTL